MQRINENTHICHAVLRGKSNLQLFEEEIQKMKILDAAANVRAEMQIQVLAYCVLDNELHLILQLGERQSAEAFLDAIARKYEATCFKQNHVPLRVDYLSDQNQFPDVNSSVHEQGVLYNVDTAIRHFRKHVVKMMQDTAEPLECCLKLHMLPVRKGIVRNPEDYWWCSYLDYMGRQWLPVTDTSCVLSQLGDNPRQSAGIVRYRHQKALKKLSLSNKTK